MKSTTYRQILAYINAALTQLGLSEAAAAQVSEVFLRAQHRGQGHHDLSYLPERLSWLQSKKVKSSVLPQIVGGKGTALVYDGGACLGELACSTIVRAACEKALEYGTGMAVVRNSNHFLAGQPYGEIASEYGCALLLFSSTDKTMTGPEGGTAIIGNNPQLLSFPLPDRPFILDMCMAYASLGTLKKTASEGRHFDMPAGYDALANPSSDPAAILAGGSLAPMGKHKGFGLALFVELLAGGLSGGHLGLEIPAGGGLGGHSQAAIAFDPSVFGNIEEISSRFITMMEDFAAQQAGIRYPGSRVEPWTPELLDSHVELSDTLSNSLEEWSTILGIERL